MTTQSTPTTELRAAADIISSLLVSTLKEATDLYPEELRRKSYYVWEAQAIDWLRGQWERDRDTMINDWAASIVRGDIVMGRDGLCKAQGDTYLAAVKGRADFRNALRQTRPVIAAARALRDKWRTPGQKVDAQDFYDAIHTVSEAADAYDKALAHEAAP